MNNKLIGIIFVVLFLLGAIPFAFTEGAPIYLFGWLPLSLAFWWCLMIVNLAFVLWVAKVFVKSSKKEGGKE